MHRTSKNEVLHGIFTFHEGCEIFQESLVASQKHLRTPVLGNVNKFLLMRKTEELNINIEDFMR
jgi:hypothetical protein